MAEHADDSEKTEEPTQKKLDDAARKGDIAKSQEVNAWFVMLGATIVIMMFSEGMFSGLAGYLKGFMAQAHQIPFDGGSLVVLFWESSITVLAALAAPLLVLVLAAIGGNLVQHAPVFSAEQMKPKLSKISPAAGAKRLFSTTSVMNFVKGIAKLAVVATVMFAIIWPERDRLDVVITADPVTFMPMLKELAVKLLLGVVAVLTVIAGADLLYQRHKWHEKQKMSYKELRDEYKQMEGDPTVKAKLRQVRIERGRKRMMANVPQASVVITNPTHYSVALKYDAGMNAPVCVAKGIDAIALKIREVATEHDIPIVENPPLARALYASVDVDGEIAPEQYSAVAKVIGFVMKMRHRRAWRSKRLPSRSTSMRG